MGEEDLHGAENWYRVWFYRVVNAFNAKTYITSVIGAPQLNVYILVLAAIENNRFGATFSTSHNEACQIEITFK